MAEMKDIEAAVCDYQPKAFCADSRPPARQPGPAHDLLNNVFKGFDIVIERAIITELKNSTYFARLILKQQNELGTKLVELDARPSDCLAIASAQKRPIYVTSSLFSQVEDMSKWLEDINENAVQLEERL